jgi:hypothetical protein
MQINFRKDETQTTGKLYLNGFSKVFTVCLPPIHWNAWRKRLEDPARQRSPVRGIVEFFKRKKYQIDVTLPMYVMTPSEQLVTDLILALMLVLSLYVVASLDGIIRWNYNALKPAPPIVEIF